MKYRDKLNYAQRIIARRKIDAHRIKERRIYSDIDKLYNHSDAMNMRITISFDNTKAFYNKGNVSAVYYIGKNRFTVNIGKRKIYGFGKPSLFFEYIWYFGTNY